MGTPEEKALSGWAIYAKPGAIKVDKKNYEAFFFESCFKFTEVLNTSGVTDSFPELHTPADSRPFSLSEETKERLLRFYGNLFESKELEAAWLQRVAESKNSKEAIQLVELSQYAKIWNALSRFLDNVVVMEATFREIEDRGRLAGLPKHLGYTNHNDSLFKGRHIDSIREVTARILQEQADLFENENNADEETVLSAPEKTILLIKKIREYAEILAGKSGDAIPVPLNTHYFEEPLDKSFPSGTGEELRNWFFVSRIIKQNFESAYVKFQSDTINSLEWRMKEEAVDPNELSYLWSIAFFDRLYRQISNTNPVNRVWREEGVDSRVFKWFKNGMLMSSYFKLLAKNEITRFKRKQSATQSLPEFDIDTTDYIYDLAEEDETGIMDNTQIRDVYFNILEMLDELNLTPLQTIILEEHYWGNELTRLEVLEEIERESSQNPRKKVDIEKRLSASRVSIKEICERTENPESGKPYSHQAGYSAANGLLEKIAKHKELLGYLTGELKLALERNDSAARREIASLITRFGKLLRYKIVTHLLSAIDELDDSRSPEFRDYLLNLLGRQRITSTMKHLEKLLKEIDRREENDLTASSNALLTLLRKFQLVDNAGVLPALLNHIDKSASAGQAALSDALIEVLGNFKTSLDLNSLDLITLDVLQPGSSDKKEAIFRMLENATWKYEKNELDTYLDEEAVNLSDTRRDPHPFITLLHRKGDLSTLKNRDLAESYVLGLLRQSLRGTPGLPSAASLVELLLKFGRSPEDIQLLL